MKRTAAIDAIRNAGFRATRQRLALYALLQRSAKPRTIAEIVRALAARDIDQVTVYRVIDAFTRASLVRAVHLFGERPRYELADHDHDHHHIVCTSCHAMEDFVGCGAEKVARGALAQSRGFAAVTGHSFDLYGLCNACARKRRVTSNVLY